MKLTLKYCAIGDVVMMEPKQDDEQKKCRKVILLVDEEDFFDMLDSVNPKNLIKYLDMRDIQHREPSVVNLKVGGSRSTPRLGALPGDRYVAGFCHVPVPQAAVPRQITIEKTITPDARH